MLLLFPWLWRSYICGQEKFFGSQRLRCLDGSRESLAISESASRRSSHLGGVMLALFLLRWCYWLSCVGFEGSFDGVLMDTIHLYAGFFDGWSERLLDLRCGSRCCVAFHAFRLWWWLRGLDKHLNPPLWSFELHR